MVMCCGKTSRSEHLLDRDNVTDQYERGDACHDGNDGPHCITEFQDVSLQLRYDRLRAGICV